MISTAWYCLLPWQVLILGGAFEQKGAGGGRGADRTGQLNLCADTVNPLRRHI